MKTHVLFVMESTLAAKEKFEELMNFTLMMQLNNLPDSKF